MRRRNLLGVDVCATDYEEASDAICRAAQARHSFAVSALAVHGVMTGVLNQVHRRRLNTLDMIVPDGQPVRWGLNLLYRDGIRDRVCGPYLMLEVCSKAEKLGLSVGFYGNRAAVLQQLELRLRELFPQLRIAAAIPSRFGRIPPEEQAELAHRIQASGTEILFVGLGCPRQEIWAYENRAHLSMPIIAVGAALDFHAGKLSLAPAWMQRRGLEWAYRFWQEPRRLWRRYLLLNPLYLLMLAAQKLRLRAYTVEAGGAIEYEGYA